MSSLEKLKNEISKKLLRVEGIIGIGIVYDPVQNDCHIEIAVQDKKRIRKTINELFPRMNLFSMDEIEFVERKPFRALSKKSVL